MFGEAYPKSRTKDLRLGSHISSGTWDMRPGTPKSGTQGPKPGSLLYMGLEIQALKLEHKT